MSLHIDEILKLKDAFDAIDTDKNGVLDLSELARFFHSVGWDVTMARICYFIFDGIEANGITFNKFQEFLPFLNELEKDPMYLWKKVFGKLDSDRKNALDFEKFCVIGRLVGITDHKELVKEFNSADGNKDKLISFEELIKALHLQ